jgi:hypothetical protein
VARIGPIWASSLACRATVFGGEYGVKYLVVHCVPFGNLRPVVGIALQEARGRRARGGVGRGAGYRCREVLQDLDGFVEHGIGGVIGGLSRWQVLADRSRWEANSGGFSRRVYPGIAGRG